MESQGQSVWLDFIDRELFYSGRLQRLIDADGLKGMTSNPTIFEKAIDSGNDYDASLKSAIDRGISEENELFEALAIEDIQRAADALRPIYDATKGRDGYISLEVSPYLAEDETGTIHAARRLWAAVRRPNLMIKVPATKYAPEAIEELIGEGININVTLLFGQKAYEQVHTAYIRGLEKFESKGGDVSRMASVASFFISRIDSLIDPQLEEKIQSSSSEGEKEKLKSILGKVAIANAKLTYQRYKEMIATERWQELAALGARPQRLLWASTGTKNKAYSDVLYVDELIGPDTVNTMPPATMDAFRDHGEVAATLEADIDEARRVMTTLEEVGISMTEVSNKLVRDGIRAFVEAASTILDAIVAKSVRFGAVMTKSGF